MNNTHCNGICKEDKQIFLEHYTNLYFKMFIDSNCFSTKSFFKSTNTLNQMEFLITTKVFDNINNNNNNCSSRIIYTFLSQR